MEKKKLSTQEMVMCALFTALLCISAYLSIPTPLPMAPKITMINFVLFLIALLFPVGQSVIIVMVDDHIGRKHHKNLTKDYKEHPGQNIVAVFDDLKISKPKTDNSDTCEIDFTKLANLGNMESDSKE